VSAREKQPLSNPDLPLFPSDLPLGDGDRCRLAGRVASVEDGVIVVADAFATARIIGQAELEVGDLVEVDVRRADGRLLLAGTVTRHRATVPASAARASSEPSSHGTDVERFVEDGIGLNLRDRARAFAIVRSFFAARAFLEVDTPLLVPSPGLDLHLDAVQADGGYLITSPEYQMKRLLVGGVPRQFQIAHVFRQGETGDRHNPEFTMLEWYRAFAGVEHVMRDTEELVTELVSAFVGAGVLPGDNGPVAVTAPFPRVTVAEAFARHAGVPEAEMFRLARDDPDGFFRTLVERVEPALAARNTPVFLVDYPIEHASLARAKPGDPRVCERFELYLCGLELCNGFGELTDPKEQRHRLIADQRARTLIGKPVYPLDEHFLAALAEGMPPSAGNALGLDRIVALCLGEREIARVMPFPAGVV
jgi:elongation factor P--(R)-beta-lysine ligase